MEQLDEASPAPVGDGSRRYRSGLIAAGVAAGIMLAGLGMAVAQESPPTTAPENKTAPADPPPEKAGRFGHKGFRFGFGPGFGHGAIHGEFTTRAPDEGFRTIATQTGEVTSVSESSIAVKSEDGFDRTYAVTEDTMVNAGRDGIGDVKTGDEVHVMAVVEGDRARAVHIADTTNLRRLGEQWRPRPPR
jgi:hypothetical protein